MDPLRALCYIMEISLIITNFTKAIIIPGCRFVCLSKVWLSYGKYIQQQNNIQPSATIMATFKQRQCPKRTACVRMGSVESLVKPGTNTSFSNDYQRNILNGKIMMMILHTHSSEENDIYCCISRCSWKSASWLMNPGLGWMAGLLFFSLSYASSRETLSVSIT